MNCEKAAKIAENDPFAPVDEQLEKSAALEAGDAATIAQVSTGEGVQRGDGTPHSEATDVIVQYVTVETQVHALLDFDTEAKLDCGWFSSKLKRA